MIHHGVTQGSAEWHHLRGYIPTASEFDRLVTPAKWEPTKGETRRNFMLQLLANRIYGLSPEDQPSVAALAHGHEWEPIARAAYEFERGVEIAEAGFFTDDTESYGASPDGLIGDDGLIEIKNPAGPVVHLSNLMDAVEYAKLPEDWTATAECGAAVTGFVRDHWVQVQGQLLVTGRAWCDLVSNLARLPMVIVRIYPNPVFQQRLQASLTSFCEHLHYLNVEAKDRGWYRPKQVPVVQDGLQALGITEADIDSLLERQRETAGAAR